MDPNSRNLATESSTSHEPSGHGHAHGLFETLGDVHKEKSISMVVMQSESETLGRARAQSIGAGGFVSASWGLQRSNSFNSLIPEPGLLRPGSTTSFDLILGRSRVEQEDENSEEDVINPNGELGKYLATTSPWALQSELSSKSEDISHPQTSSNTNVRLLCLPQPFQVENPITKLIPTRIRATLTKLFMFCCDLIRFIRIGRARAKLNAVENDDIRDLEQGSPASKDISHLFTNEYRIIKNIKQIQRHVKEFGNTINSISDTSTLLGDLSIQNNSQNVSNEQKTEQVKQLKLQSVEFNRQLKFINDLASIHNTLISKLENKSISMESKANSIIVENANVDITEERCDTEHEVTEEETIIFECAGKGQEVPNTDEIKPHDEVYEVFVGSQSEETTVTSVSKDQEIFKELKTVQNVVITELKKELMPRRVEMKERENQAYRDLYGHDPEPEDEDVACTSDPDESFVLVQQSDDKEEERFRSSTMYDPPRFSSTPDLATELAKIFNQPRAGKEEEFSG